MSDDPHLLAMDHDEGPCIYCDLVEYTDDLADDRHEAIPQPGCNMCVCGLHISDASAHLGVDA